MYSFCGKSNCEDKTCLDCFVKESFLWRTSEDLPTRPPLACFIVHSSVIFILSTTSQVLFALSFLLLVKRKEKLALLRQCYQGDAH